MNITVGIKTTTGDKIFRNVYYVRSYDGFLYVSYKFAGEDKKAVFEMEYIISFVIG